MKNGNKSDSSQYSCKLQASIEQNLLERSPKMLRSQNTVQVLLVEKFTKKNP